MSENSCHEFQLEIEHPKKEQMGIYQCVISNDRGTVSAAAKLSRSRPHDDNMIKNLTLIADKRTSQVNMTYVVCDTLIS